MKRVMYIGAIIGAYILFWLILGVIFAIIFGASPNFGYAVGGWCGQPFVILLAVGIALLFRKLLYKFIFKTSKSFKSNVAYWLIGIGIIWGVWTIGVRLYFNSAQEQLVELYYQR